MLHEGNLFSISLMVWTIFLICFFFSTALQYVGSFSVVQLPEVVDSDEEKSALHSAKDKPAPCAVRLGSEEYPRHLLDDVQVSGEDGASVESTMQCKLLESAAEFCAVLFALLSML